MLAVQRSSYDLCNELRQICLDKLAKGFACMHDLSVLKAVAYLMLLRTNLKNMRPIGLPAAYIYPSARQSFDSEAFCECTYPCVLAWISNRYLNTCVAQICLLQSTKWTSFALSRQPGRCLREPFQGENAPSSYYGPCFCVLAYLCCSLVSER